MADRSAWLQTVALVCFQGGKKDWADMHLIGILLMEMSWKWSNWLCKTNMGEEMKGSRVGTVKQRHASSAAVAREEYW
jgi:hypothetical protein